MTLVLVVQCQLNGNREKLLQRHSSKSVGVKAIKRVQACTSRLEKSGARRPVHNQHAGWCRSQMPRPRCRALSATPQDQYVDRNNAEQHKLATTYEAKTANQIDVQCHDAHASISKDQSSTEASCHGRLCTQPALKHYLKM